MVILPSLPESCNTDTKTGGGVRPKAWGKPCTYEQSRRSSHDNLICALYERIGCGFTWNGRMVFNPHRVRSFNQLFGIVGVHVVNLLSANKRL